MVDRAFLKPRSVELPSQGDFQFTPIIRVFDEATPAALQAAMTADFGVQQQSTTDYYVIEEIDYQVYNTLSPMAETRYSAMVWGTEIKIV